ncbi:hypothetical protein IY230_03730 [Acholeplasma laidlawii]|nr:hypothetical protein [Acholeplasma laidlawii]
MVVVVHNKSYSGQRVNLEIDGVLTEYRLSTNATVSLMIRAL